MFGLKYPRRGDIIMMDFGPLTGNSIGHEQSGRRPALVVSDDEYNKKTGLFLACPITKKGKGYPYEEKLPPGLKSYGFILCDQLGCFDFKTRFSSYVETVPENILIAVLDKFLPLIS